MLLLTNSFSTGGVETHILSLAKGLLSRGYFVAVASAGGTLEEELAKLGILHIYLPLDRRGVLRILLARRLLKRAVLEYRFDILHAHSRLSAFVVSLLPKSLRRGFVTTAHLDFKVTPLTRFFSRWGEKTLAVSEDIRAYLVREYGLSYRRIMLTVNGIDTDRFAKKPCGEELVETNREEKALDSNQKEKIILHISRIDRDRAAVAFLLCDVMPALRERFHARLIIVGGGELLPALEKQVAEDALLHDAVTIVGEAVDVTPYLAIADLFVGVSRAALEAMACGIPTILAGNSGYFGIYRSERLTEAAATNFCCRGAEKLNAPSLLKDLSDLLGEDEATLSFLRNECRETVLKGYSLDKMTNDAETLYAQLAPKTKRAENLILGYHGFGNLGDELLLEKMIEGIGEIDPAGKIAVISQNASQTAKEFSVKTVSRQNPFAMLSALFSARVLYLGGGTLLQKETSRRSYYYYAFWITLAKLFGKWVVFYANGFGDFTEKEERSLMRLLAGNCVITLRDGESFSLAERLSAMMPQDKKPYLALTADSALALQALPKVEADALFSGQGIDCQSRYFVLAISGQKRSRSLERALEKAMIVASEKGYSPIFLLMQPDMDAPLAEWLAKRFLSRTGKKAKIASLSPQGALTLIASASFLIASRYHALVFGAMSKIPLVCLSDSEKCRRFCNETGLSAALMPKPDSETLLYALPFLFEKQPRLIAKSEAVEGLTALARTTPQRIREGLDTIRQPLSKRLMKKDKV